jgi:hypothetical protein
VAPDFYRPGSGLLGYGDAPELALRVLAPGTVGPALTFCF